MNPRTEAAEHYQQALKVGKKTQKNLIHLGQYPYLQILDEILPGYALAGQEELGTIEIPADRIVGTKTRGRSDAFAANFMPLIPDKSEFALKWQNLCQYHLGEAGIRDPIFCYEFLGRFYVQEGNKRVSVLRHLGAPRIAAQVKRILPHQTEEPRILAYFEFLEFYKSTGLYQVQFRKPGDYGLLLSYLGKEPGDKWQEQEMRTFSAYFQYFRDAFRSLGGESLGLIPEEALLIWLQVYPFRDLESLPLNLTGKR